ncbi:hypothetical protein LCGC14_1459230 [marine sediment metagenome]|uniref:HD domain-containing protein n=1 Tax=marine sediment metagenome TaxID=412755 RepID=A0A0F9JG49_9ZZZZ
MNPTENVWTASGRQIDPENPDPSQIDLQDIAISLAKQCRFTGHCKGFYSVAGHSLNMLWVLQKMKPLFVEAQRWALLHDGAETYMNDLNKPTKDKISVRYKRFEGYCLHAIASRFGLIKWRPHIYPDIVRVLDSQMLCTEIHILMPEALHEHYSGGRLPSELEVGLRFNEPDHDAIAEEFIIEAMALGLDV